MVPTSVAFRGRNQEVSLVDMNQALDTKNFLDNGSISTGMNVGVIGTPSHTGQRHDAESPDQE